MYNTFDNFLHGADYNPEQWLEYPEILKKDLELMKKAKCNVMSIGIFSWIKLEPSEGVFDFEWLDNIIENLYKNGIKTILSTQSGSKPAWLSKKYSEVLRTEENRVKRLHGIRHNHCYTSPIYREKVAILNEKLASRYSGNPAVIMWHISNEYSGECHCELCQNEFRKWLKNRYKTIENLNREWWTCFWGHTFSDWDEIESPAPHGENQIHALNLDWKRFTTYQTIDFMNEEIKSVKKYNENIPVTTNFILYHDGLNYFKFKDNLDIISIDSYPEWHSEDNIETAIRTAAFYDIIRSIKKQPFILMESTPSMTNWQRVSKLKKPNMHLLSSMQAVAHGSDSVQYFQWRKSRGSSEKLHGAVVDHYGKEDTRVFNDVSKVGEILEKIEEIKGSKTQAQVAIVYDWENLWAINDSQGPRNIGINYDDIVKEYYRVFWEQGINVDFVDMECDISKYKLVVAPILYMIRNSFEDKIRKFVKSGGTFITTYFSGIVNETDLCYLGGFPGNLMDVFGIRSEEIDALYDNELNIIKMTNTDKTYKCTQLCDLINVNEAEILATYNNDFYKGRAALTKNKFGDGHAYYIASHNEKSFNRDLFNEIIEEFNIEKNIDIDIPYGVTISKRESENKEYFFIQNYSDKEVTIKLNNEYVDTLTNNVCDLSLTIEDYGIKILEKAKKIK